MRLVLRAARKCDNSGRETANCIIVIRRKRRRQQVGSVTAKRIDRVDRVGRLSHHRAGVPVTPAFAHHSALVAEAAAVSVQAVRGSVRDFVNDDTGVGRSVFVRRRTGPEVHLHTSAAAVCRRCEVSVVGTR